MLDVWNIDQHFPQMTQLCTYTIHAAFGTAVAPLSCTFPPGTASSARTGGLWWPKASSVSQSQPWEIIKNGGTSPENP